MISTNTPQHLMVTSVVPNMYVGNNGPMSGQLRYNSSRNCIEVSDGVSWMILNTEVDTVSLNAQASDAITWAIGKMNEERELREMAKTYPAIEDGLKAVEDANNYLQTLKVLCSGPELKV